MNVKFDTAPLFLVGFTTAIGALAGSWLIGLAIGLGIVIAATMLPPPPGSRS